MRENTEIQVLSSVNRTVGDFIELAQPQTVRQSHQPDNAQFYTQTPSQTRSLFDAGASSDSLATSPRVISDPISVLVIEQGHRTTPQGIPSELPNLLAEIVFVLVCTFGQFVICMDLGHVVVPQVKFQEALGIASAQTPWLLNSSALASGLSVIVAGPVADLAAPRPLIVSAFLWQAVWNVVLAVSVSPRLKILFFVARGMQGLAVGVLVSASMSILGRVYKPGVRKTRVFSMMAAAAPFGYWVGCVQGGGLADQLPWIFASTSIFLFLCAAAARIALPNLQPSRDSMSLTALSLRQLDYLGASLSVISVGLILFGLTQGSAVGWKPYTYSCLLVGFLFLVVIVFVERRVTRPLVPRGIWQTPGFAALLVSYMLGYGCYAGAWQFYAIQFWQRYQEVSPLVAALYLLPNAIVGVFAAWVVSKMLHLVPGHWIFATSMVCFGVGPVFFLPQNSNSSYWALSMPGVAIATFGPDLGFAAATIFITSNVPRSYQGSAGSLLLTAQALSLAVVTSLAESIGTKVERLPSGVIGLSGFRAIWWFGLALAITGSLITVTKVRIPKAEEKEHVQ